MCTSLEREYLEDWSFVAKTVVTSEAFEQCMYDRIVTQGDYIPCQEDPAHSTPQESYETALEAVRNVNDLELRCDALTNSGNASAYIGSYGNYTDDTMTFHSWLDGVVESIGELDTHADDWTMSDYDQYGNRTGCSDPSGECRWAPFPWPINQGSDIVVHEALHQQGYRHAEDSNDTTCTPTSSSGYSMYSNSMPYIVGSCINRVVTRSADHCSPMCEGRDADSLFDCRKRGRLNLVDTYTEPSGGYTCSPHFDPSRNGLGVLELDSNSELDLVDNMPHGERFGSWVNGMYDSVAVTGDIWPYPSDGREEFVVMSGWGIGVIGWDENNSFDDEAMAADGTTFTHWGDGSGEWTHQTGCNGIWHAGRFSSQTQYGSATLRDEIFIECSNTGIGILSVYSGQFRTRNYEPWGTAIGGPYGHWTIGSTNDFVGFGDFNGDGQTDILVQSGWGIGLLSRTGSNGALQTLDLRSYSSSFGSWSLGSDNEVLAVGDFNGNGRDEFIIRDGWGIGVIGIKSGDTRFSDYMMRSFGTTVSSSWTLRSTDTVAGAGRLKWGPSESIDKDSILLMGDDGLAVMNFNSSNMSPYIDSNQHVQNGNAIAGLGSQGHWSYDTADNWIPYRAFGDWDGDGFTEFRIKSDWGAAVVGRTSASDSLRVHSIHKYSCPGTSDYNACHGGLAGGWLVRRYDGIITQPMQSPWGHDFAVFRRY
ncbi:FG-GAP repeat domain-containing protein [Persicimonas caeni]|uniref:FG-GAP repeat domain-containing protein n=1 Tax=Persicimonas caeni TaxID=2292766 RepID=UPI00143D6D3C|nr:VCBS repeat-containing protein [Persicimonas caeni]